MPLYEYSCNQCGHDFEEIQSFDASPPPCPDCKANDVIKKISQSAFHLKGSGWYNTGYSKDQPSQSKKEKTGKEKGPEKPQKKEDQKKDLQKKDLQKKDSKKKESKD